jgi:hypothetical protein
MRRDAQGILSIIANYLNKEKLRDGPTTTSLTSLTVVATLTTWAVKQRFYQRGRLSSIAWYLQALNLSDFFFL